MKIVSRTIWSETQMLGLWKFNLFSTLQRCCLFLKRYFLFFTIVYIGEMKKIHNKSISRFFQNIFTNYHVRVSNEQIDTKSSKFLCFFTKMKNRPNRFLYSQDMQLRPKLTYPSSLQTPISKAKNHSFFQNLFRLMQNTLLILVTEFILSKAQKKYLFRIFFLGYKPRGHFYEVFGAGDSQRIYAL